MARGLLGIASAIALVTLLSKGFGFGRELVIAYVFGASIPKDAYTAAYIIPAFSLVMLGGLTGPFHTTTQKILTTLRQRGEEAQIPGVVATLIVGVSAVMGLLSLATFAFAPALIWLVASKATPEVSSLAAHQLQIMSPLILLGALIGIFCGISNDKGDYMLPSLTPLIASVAVIVVILIRPDPMSLAWGTMIGGVGQFLLQLPAVATLLRAGQIRLDFRHPEVIGMARLIGPAAIGSTVGTLNVIIGTNFASALPAGSISVFDYANKLIQLPLGILMTALLIPLFPLLTQAVVSGERETLFHRLNQGLGTVALATLPLIALFISAGEPLVSIMYQRGAFDAEDALLTYQVLGFTALGIFTYGARDLMIRVFYALDDSRTPLWVSIGSMALTAGLMAIVIGPFGLQGLAAATSIVTAFNCVLIGVLLRRKLGALPLGAFWPVFFKALGVAVVAGAAAWALGRVLPPALDTQAGFWAASLRFGLQAALLGTVYAAGLSAMGMPVWQNVSRLGARFTLRGK